MKRIHLILGITVALVILIGVFCWSNPIFSPANSLFHNYFPSWGFTSGVLIKKYPGNYARLLNYACFKFETPDGIKIITDPYYMDETVAPNIVTESHQHLDHRDISKLVAPYQLIKTPGKFKYHGINITGIPGKHDIGDQAVTNIIFLFDIAGIKIAHFASQGEVPDEATLKKLAGIDILMIQCFQYNFSTAKLSPAQCCQIIERLHPKLVIPEHGQMYVENALANHFHQKVKYLPNGEIIVTKKLLSGIHTPQIMVLDRPPRYSLKSVYHP